MIGFLVVLLVVLVIFGLAFWIVGQLPMGPPFKSAAQIVVGAIAILVLLGMLFGWVTLPIALRHP